MRFERFAPFFPQILKSLLLGLLLVLIPTVVLERFARFSALLWSLLLGKPLFSNFVFSEIRLSFSSGLLLVLKCSSLFRVVCSLFSIPFLRSISRVSFERFASCCQFSSLIQAACSLFSNYQVPFGRSAPCSQILQSSSGSLLVLNFFSRFRPACSCGSNSLVLFVLFAPCSQML